MEFKVKLRLEDYQSFNKSQLFIKLKNEYYKPSLDSPSVYGKIQAIVEKFSN